MIKKNYWSSSMRHIIFKTSHC